MFKNWKNRPTLLRLHSNFLWTQMLTFNLSPILVHLNYPPEKNAVSPGYLIIYFVEKHAYIKWIYNTHITSINIFMHFQFLYYGYYHKLLWWLKEIHYFIRLNTFFTSDFFLNSPARYVTNNSLEKLKFYFQFRNYGKHVARKLTSFWCFYCWLWKCFTPYSSVFIVNFENVNTGWEAFIQLNIRDHLIPSVWEGRY